MDAEDIDVYQKFIGKRIQVVWEKPGDISTVKLDNDPTIETIKSMYPKVRVWLPGTLGTADFRTDRLNVKIGPVVDRDYASGFCIKKIYWG